MFESSWGCWSLEPLFSKAEHFAWSTSCISGPWLEVWKTSVLSQKGCTFLQLEVWCAQASQHRASWACVWGEYYSGPKGLLPLGDSSVVWGFLQEASLWPASAAAAFWGLCLVRCDGLNWVTGLEERRECFLQVRASGAPPSPFLPCSRGRRYRKWTEILVSACCCYLKISWELCLVKKSPANADVLDITVVFSLFCSWHTKQQKLLTVSLTEVQEQ